MSGLFVPAPGGATAPGGTPWFAMGGPTSGGASSASAADPGVDALSAIDPYEFYVPWSSTPKRFVKGSHGWYGKGGVRLVKRELSGHRVELVHPGTGVVLGEWREDSFQDSIGRGLRRVARKIKDAPGIVGFALGFALPFAPLSFVTKLGLSAGVGVAGYYSPQGSYMRRFSIGAGVGGAVGSGLWLYENLPNAGSYLYDSLKVIDFRPPPEFKGWAEGLKL